MSSRLTVTATPQPEVTHDAERAGDKLRRFLNAYWLRPENALWMTLRSDAQSSCEPAPPAVDLGCGDGLYSFLHCGGRLDPAFDVFSSVQSISAPHDTEADMFDCHRDAYRPVIHERPTRTFDVGVDIKPSMLQKASALDFYGRLVEHDNNQPLPFDDAAFAGVYCNTAYWITNINPFLAELARITRTDGLVVLHVKLSSMRRYSLEPFRVQLGERALEIIGRNRCACWPTLADRGTWEQRFARAGLVVREATPFVTRTHAHLWDIGLRPIAPLLVKMTESLHPGTRAEIKREWVDLFLDLLGPLRDPTLDLFPGDNEPAEMQYVLTPR